VFLLVASDRGAVHLLLGLQASAQVDAFLQGVEPILVALAACVSVQKLFGVNVKNF
jgi:hypothetical protein